jgi:uncharacterized protein (TIGR03435 family)
LKFHRGTKEMPVYHMIQAKKSGLFKAAAPDETFSWNVTPGPAGTLRSKATKESIGDFVQLVGVSTDKPVIDKTGITGYIDYDILITPPEGRSQEETNRAISLCRRRSARVEAGIRERSGRDVGGRPSGQAFG